MPNENENEHKTPPATARVKNESGKAYAAFKTYIELGDTRSVGKVARKCKKSGTLLHRWKKKFNWDERLARYYTEQAEIAVAAEQQAALEHAQRRERRKNQLEEDAWEVSRLMVEKAREILAFPIAERTILPSETGDGSTVIVKPVNFRAGDAARLLETADTIGRLANGLPSKVTEIHGRGGKDLIPDGSTVLVQPIIKAQYMSDEQTRKLMEQMNREAAEGENG